jgi:large subunit ribosomal protein L32
MAVPKRKVSKARRNRRRAHDSLSRPYAGLCPQCRQPKPVHRACPSCGYYKGKQVMPVKEV